ncbi:DUF2383 domain-containing protein [Pseudoroseomonas globiformis]|uniref:DUF2383 domain-containing protein n=1 Tax=Teichococcus globiformis TaxID=2307229 RepID=A0ABV7G429_9PROT
MNHVGQSGSEPGSGEAVLRSICETLRASHRGYDQARHLTSDRFLRIEFTELAERRQKMADDAEALLPEGPREAHVPMGAVHRVFLDLRGSLFGQSRQRVLQQVVRNEAALEDAFDDALEASLSQEARHLLQRQHRQVRATRDRYAAMLDEDMEALPVPAGGHGWLARFDRLTQPLTRNPILAAIVVSAASALTARLLRGRRFH